MRLRIFSIMLVLAAAFASIAIEAKADELPLPEVPTSLRTPGERAAYIVSHFWDGMDFSDTLRSRNNEFVEQNFVNYLSLFPHTPADTLKTAVPRLMQRAEADTVAYNLLADLADKYLYDPESPMLDEESYIIFLESITGRGFMEASRRTRFDYELADAMKNRKGCKASDFDFIDSKGAKTSLYTSGDGKSMRILLFYDPDCDHCHEVIRELETSPVVNGMLREGKISILAIYAEGDETVWNGAKNSLPSGWTNGYSPDNRVEMDDIYILRRTPTLYLLDSDNTVLLKDPTAEQIIRYVSEKSNQS
ncbi:MAG: DUF5106 domain-containing protein [Bacteroides sp.]|nr:DUF5106 domain-containing protein [Bacteroides sp.]MCM1389335.1 DUF5106 domain-containing protein [Bacteroides sp.]